METLGVVCCVSFLIAFAVGAVIAIRRDLGIRSEDPETARKRKERNSETEAEREKQAKRYAETAARQRERNGCLAARAHLRQFYNTHRHLFGNACPPVVMTAFIRSEMGDEVKSTQQWNVCLRKITELLPLVIRGKNGRIRLQQIDAEIRECRQAIAHLGQVRLKPEDAEMAADTKQGMIDMIRELEAQKRMIFNGGAA